MPPALTSFYGENTSGPFDNFSSNGEAKQLELVAKDGYNPVCAMSSRQAG